MYHKFNMFEYIYLVIKLNMFIFQKNKNDR